MIDTITWYENIIKITGVKKLTYVGTSMGGLINIMALSDETTSKYIQDHTEHSIYLAPAIYLSYIKDTYLLENARPKEYYDDLRELSEKEEIYNFNSGNYNTDTNWMTLFTKLNEKHGFIDKMKCNLLKVDSSVDTLKRLFIPD